MSARHRLPLASDLGRSALWTLHSRSAFPRVLDDPHGIRIRKALGEAVLSRFGRPEMSFAIRAKRFDHELTDYLSRNPGANVVSLGEGLETQRYRVGGFGCWTSVDLPETIAVREQFIPTDDRHRHRPVSANAMTWLDDLGDGPAFVVAQGLFMYLDLVDVRRIVGALAERGNVDLMFDVVPRWVAALSHLKPPMAQSLRMPPMPWGAGRRGLERLLASWAGPSPRAEMVPVPLPKGPLPAPVPRLGWTLAAIVRL